MWVKVLVSVLSGHLIIGIISPATAQSCNYTNSTYGKNRNLILASLPANVSANGGFFSATIGQDPDKVYALGMCSGNNFTSDACYRNLNTSVNDLIATCPNKTEDHIWGNGPCLVRYANREFFGILDLSGTVAVYVGIQNVSNLKFDTAWESLMASVVTNASMVSSGLKYATGEAYLTPILTIYSQMQCTSDLSQDDCDNCLMNLANWYEASYRGYAGFALNTNCFFRWDVSPFYVSNPATSVSPPPPPLPATNRKVFIVVPIAIFLAVVILATAVLIKWRKEKKLQDDKICKEREEDEVYDKSYVESLEFDFDAIRVATNNFSDKNMLGQGGFGSVYKGKLPDGRDVAVKRLSTGNSRQGEQEFKNEVRLLAKLQHRNLVRLLGFSLEQKERILIYEFLPNSSLDRFIFDPVELLPLNWEKRYKIIEGIVKGLVYLHEDSHYRIIHRDLKAANILLDGEMNPKIADFGIAKLFTVDKSQANTRRIVGTFGYMAPEYLRHGKYSVKSDVYGFGVLLLEIISGQKVSNFAQEEVGESLLTYAWKKWNEGATLELIDPILRDGSSISEVVRCIHLGLLCVQENIAHRPTMASIFRMLISSYVTLPAPLKPEFYMHSIMETEMMETEMISVDSHISNQSKSKTIRVSINEA